MKTVSGWILFFSFVLQNKNIVHLNSISNKQHIL
jgi:hypothetical protein